MLAEFRALSDPDIGITATRDKLIAILADNKKIERWKSFGKKSWANVLTLEFPFLDAFRPACDFQTQDNYARGEAQADAPTDNDRLFSNKYSDVRRDALLSFQNMWRAFEVNTGAAVPAAAAAAPAAAAAAAGAAANLANSADAYAVFNSSGDTKVALSLAAIQYGQVCMLIDAIDEFDAARGVDALKRADVSALLAASTVRDEFVAVRARFAGLQQTNKEWVGYAVRGFKWVTSSAVSAAKTIQYLGARVARLDLPRALPDMSGRLARSLVAASGPKIYTDTRFRQLDVVRKHLLAFARCYNAQRTARYRYGFTAGIRDVASVAFGAGAFEANPNQEITYNMDTQVYDLIIKFVKVVKATPGQTAAAWEAQCEDVYNALDAVISCYINEDLIAAWLAFDSFKHLLEFPLRRAPSPPSRFSADETQIFTRRFARPIRKMYFVALGQNGLYKTRVDPVSGRIEVALGAEPLIHKSLSLLVRATRVCGTVAQDCRQLRAEILSDRKTLRDKEGEARKRFQGEIDAKTDELGVRLVAIEGTQQPAYQWAWALGGAPAGAASAAPTPDEDTALTDAEDKLNTLVKAVSSAESLVFTTINVDNQDPEPRTEALLQSACEDIRKACADVETCAAKYAVELRLAPDDVSAVAAAAAFIRGLADELLHGKRRPSSIEESGVAPAAPPTWARPVTVAYVPPPASALTYEWKEFDKIESALNTSDYQSSTSLSSYSSHEDHSGAPVVVQFDSMELLKSNANSVYNMIGRTSDSKLAPVLYGLVLDNSGHGSQQKPSQADINELLCRIGAEIGIRAPVDRASLSTSRGRPLKGWLVRYRPFSPEPFEIIYVRSDTVTGSSIQNFTLA